MNLVLDENIDARIASRLRTDGDAICYVSELSPGIADQEVLRIANETASLLVTCDKDFGELVFRSNHLHQGILLVRLEGMNSEEKSNYISAAIRDYEHQLRGAFSVLTAQLLRIRKNA